MRSENDYTIVRKIVKKQSSNKPARSPFQVITDLSISRQLVRDEKTGAEIRTEKWMREKGNKERGWQADGFSMRVLARSGRTEREMNFGKREMAAPVDAQSGKRRNTAVRQFPDVITSPCSRTERPGPGEPRDIALFSVVNASELQRGFVTQSLLYPPLTKMRENEGMSCLTTS